MIIIQENLVFTGKNYIWQSYKSAVQARGWFSLGILWMGRNGNQTWVSYQVYYSLHYSKNNSFNLFAAFICNVLQCVLLKYKCTLELERTFPIGQIYYKSATGMFKY
jgi:hypothetical protein